MLDTRYKNPALSPEERTEILLGQMTLEEKIAQIVGNGVMAGELPNIAEALPHGAGHINGTFLLGEENAEARAASIEKIQRYMVEGTRLGIPALFHMEAVSGSFYTDAAVPPAAIAMGATFDTEAVEDMACFIGRQNRAEGYHHAFGPVLDLGRDQRWGRLGETYGEDPTLVSEMGAAFIRGIQGRGDLRRGVGATGKHFLAYGMNDGGQNLGNQRATPRELREVHAKPWAAAIEAGLSTVMNAYGIIDGEPIVSSPDILRRLLREELGFNGLVVADYCSVERCVDNWDTCETYADAGEAALRAGLDVELPDPKCFNEEFLARVREGRIPMDLIDAAVCRVLELKFRLGLFEHPYPDYAAIAAIRAEPERTVLPEKLCREAVVLTKNTGNLLPLKKGAKIALIGPHANCLRLLFGGYMYAPMLEMKARLSEMFIGMEGMGGAVEAAKHKPLLVLEDIEAEIRRRYPWAKTLLAALGDYTENIAWAQGCDVTGTDTSGFSEALALAREADVAVLALGGRGGWIPGCTSGEGVEYPHIGLHGVQAALAKAVLDTGKPTVIIHMDVRPMAEPEITEAAGAVLEAWHLGASGAGAIADILFGAVNPSGKLPLTCARGEYQLPMYMGQPRATGFARALRPGEPDAYQPLFPFGHGLSYTTFAYSDLRLSQTNIDAGGTVTVSCKVKNTGAVPGRETVQLYFSDVLASLVRPGQELAGFQSVTLAPGEEKTVSFHLAAAQTAFIGKDGDYIVEPGEIRLMVGASSQDIRLRGSFTITGETVHAPRRPAFCASCVE